MSEEKTDLERVVPPIEALAKENAGLRTHYGGSYGYGYGYGQPADQKIHLRELWRVIRKRRWLILTLVLIATTVVTLEVYRTKNTYQASVMVEIGKDANVLGRPGSIFGDDYDPFYMVNIKTKMLMIKSHSLLEGVVVRNGFDQDPRFLQTSGKRTISDAIKTIGAKFGLSDAPKNEAFPEAVAGAGTDPTGERSPEDQQRIERSIAALDGSLTVEPVKETRALKISFTHTDPKIAKVAANAVADTFLERNFENKTVKFTNAAKWLEDSTRRLKAKVEEAEQALATYTRENGIFATDKDGTLTTSKLASLHDQVLRASTDRMLKQTLFEEVKRGNVEKLPEAYADMLFKSSPKTVELQKQLGQLQADAAELSVKYGPQNPKVVEVQNKIAAIQDQLNQSTKSLEGKLQLEYERAVRDEAMLNGALEKAKSEAIQQNQASIQANILKQDVETNKALYQDFLQKTNQANAQIAEQQNNFHIIEPAQEPGSPVGPRRLMTILITLLLSTAAGVGIAFLLEYLDNTIKTVEDVSRYAQLPALSVIPAIASTPRRGVAARSGRGRALKAGNGRSGLPAEITNQLGTLDTRSSAAEAYRVLRTSVLLSAAGQAPKTILVTSGQPGEGKTTTVVNTAVSLAQLGASVLVIDCDLRRPTSHKLLGVAHTEGLSTYLSGKVPLDAIIHKLPLLNLSLIPCGPIPPNPAELIISDRMKEMLKELQTRFDHILIDSPPLIHVTDPVILSTMVDGVILVVHGGKSTRDIVRRARQELSTVGAKIFGVVLNNVDLRKDGYSEYDYYRYYSAYTQEGAKDAPRDGRRG